MNLKTCPFCGGKPFIEEKSRGFVNGEPTHVTYIRCSVCNARSPRFDLKDCENYVAVQKAADAWNKRVEPQDVEVLTKGEKYRLRKMEL